MSENLRGDFFDSHCINYRVAQKNWQILTDFQNYFTAGIRKKLVITLLLKIPLHLKCVAALPCEKCQFLESNNID